MAEKTNNLKKLVVIPTYNEKENAALIIAAVMELPGDFHVLIVDDGSPDGTADIVKDLMQHTYGQRLHIQERTGKLGLGTAYIHGFKWALQQGYDYIFEMDADFSHKPKDLIRLFEACHTEGADLSVGSRYVKGGKLENWPADRIFLSKGASFYTRIITWMPVRDSTAGFVCYKRKVLETLPLDEIRFIGYAFQIEMKYRSWKAGFKIKEVPITFTDRVLGASKMSKGIIKEAVLGVWKMKWFI
ncbi:dolichyl-phosphate beta-D-mannosyltransferase [Taibaiella sp. KBW10]|uniref:polyprenol monophosphomannose synthase n=1 Tax=Taibaiella sp. KBW10 TaxID=2153357 RepID=UPI000F5B066F|nr:polyprenol monophosphomannose synthase [Taibaiella sp. KBW10]RQO31204.1 dolichyl-phosphate beta-D-mannosyltransferase [Taibaiella sp. KBW10]